MNAATTDTIRKLRKKGMSIPAIAKKLGMSKSRVRWRSRDVLLTATQKAALTQKQKEAGAATLVRIAKKKHAAYARASATAAAQGIQDVLHCSTRDRFMIGLGLYWGEGYKKGSAELGFTNTDPRMIRFFIRWLEECFGITRDMLILRVSVNALHQGREKDLLAFWSRIARVSLSQFTKTSFVRTAQKKTYANHAIHYGTLRVKVRKGSLMRVRILAALDALP